MKKKPVGGSPWVLPTIVLSQFCCAALWFAGNAVMDNLVEDFGFSPDVLGHLTSAVQFGFIAGTLVFALFTIADRFSPSKVFLVSALLGAVFNLGTIWEGNGLGSLLLFRFLTGFFLAGIYPVGMKIAADHFEKGLGKSLGFLVGALVLGTAFPHLLKEFTGQFPWHWVLLMTSALSVAGGAIMFLWVPDGPYRKASKKADLTAFFQVFRNPPFRKAAFGYFGHMWELYAFWAFVPVMLRLFMEENPGTNFNLPLLSFLVIGLGGFACVVGGFLAQRFGTKTIAASALSLSMACCLLFPLAFASGNPWLFLAFLVFWGWVVIADSPLFSTLVAQNAPAENKGTALTIVNSIGFGVTIFSIQLMGLLDAAFHSPFIYMLLAIGPALGLWALTRRTVD